MYVQNTLCKRMGWISDLQQIMAVSRDYDELLFAWKGWRDSAGKVLRQDYKRYVELANKAATLNGKTCEESFYVNFNILRGCSLSTPAPFHYNVYRSLWQWSFLALLVWNPYLWGRPGGSLEGTGATLSECACLCSQGSVQKVWPWTHQREGAHPCSFVG